MVQPSGSPSITLQLTHDLVRIGPYTLNYWEAIRGFQINFYATVGVGAGVPSISNISLQPRFEYYFHSSTPIMFSDINPVFIPAITSLAPYVASIPTMPLYPGLVKLQITGTAGGRQLQIDSGKGRSSQSDNWFYVVERESALLAAFVLSNLAR